MALTLDTVKNFAEWDQAHWRTFFQTHGPTLAHTEIPEDVETMAHGKEFQGAMIKVGILGSNALFDQTPSIWSVELINKIPFVTEYGEPRHFTNVTLAATRLMLDSTDFDEALLIKQESAEPLMLLRTGHTWYFVDNRTQEGDGTGGVHSINETRVVVAWETFERAAKICVDENSRKSLVAQDLTQHQHFSLSLTNLVASYCDLVVDKDAQKKRKLRKVLYTEFNKRPSCHKDWVNDAQNAAKTASGIVAEYLDEPENYRKEPEPTQKVEQEPLPSLEEPEEPQSWRAYISEKISSVFHWIISLFY